MMNLRLDHRVAVICALGMTLWTAGGAWAQGLLGFSGLSKADFANVIALDDCHSMGCPVTAEAASDAVISTAWLDDGPQNLAVLLRPEPLEPGRFVVDADGEFLALTSEPTWLFVVDDDPASFFAHDVRVALVGLETGTTTWHATDEYPELDGEVPAVDPQAEMDPDVRIFEWPEPGSAEAEESIPTVAGFASAVVEPTSLEQISYSLEADGFACPEEMGGFEQECEDTYLCAVAKTRHAFVLYGPPRKGTKWSTGRHDAKDITNARTHLVNDLQKHGFPAAQVAQVNLGKKSSVKTLEKHLKTIAKTMKCRDEVLVFYVGHGQELVDKKTGAVTYGLAKRGSHVVTGEKLAAMFSVLPTCHLNVMIDACHSGGLLSSMKQLPGLERMYTSVRASEKAKVSAIDKWRIKSKEGKKKKVTVYEDPFGSDKELGGEYMSGAVHFFKTTAFKTSGWSVRQLIDTAHQWAIARDVGKIAGVTHPQSYKRTTKCHCNNDGSRTIGLGECPDFEDYYIAIDAEPTDESETKLDVPVSLY